MKHYEYMSDSVHVVDLSKKLETLDGLGWELVTVHPPRTSPSGFNYVEFYMKREKTAGMKANELYKILTKPEDFFPFWLKEVECDDSRGNITPSVFKGTVVGIQQDKILLRVNNDITAWYPLNNSNLLIYKEVGCDGK